MDIAILEEEPASTDAIASIEVDLSPLLKVRTPPFGYMGRLLLAHLHHFAILD